MVVWYEELSSFLIKELIEINKELKGNLSYENYSNLQKIFIKVYMNSDI